LAGFSFVWYFVPPYEFFRRLAAGALGPWPLGTGLVLAFVVLVDLLFLRRLFCREFCPYGRFQTIIAHPDTLTIRALPEELGRCIDCRSCVNSCPMGIDIRDGFQIECINCARCIDACRKVMAPRKQKAIIAYTFGTGDRGWRGLFNPRLILIGMIFLTLATAFFYNATHRQSLSFKIGRSPAVPARVQGRGRILTFFTGYLRNLSEEPRSLQITATDSSGRVLELKGPVKIHLKGGEKKSVRFGVVSDNPPLDETMAILISIYENGKRVSDSTAYITHVEE
jgi:polyferredoxin